MPMIAELREIDGALWAKLEMDAVEGQVTLWTVQEIKDHGHACVRDFLIDLFQRWKDQP